MSAAPTFRILIEVMYKADYCLPCLFMDEAVREVIPKYDEGVEYQRVDFLKGNGKNYISPDYTVVGDYAHSVSFSLDGKLIFVQVKLNIGSGWRYIAQVYEVTTGKVMDQLYYTGGVNPTKTCVNNKSQNFILYANWQGGGTDLFSKVVAYSAN